MRATGVLLGVVLVALALPPLPAKAQTQAAQATIVDFAFEAPELTVPVGTTVTWTNTGARAPHRHRSRRHLRHRPDRAGRDR